MTTRLVYPKTSVNNTGLFLSFRAYNYSKSPAIDGALADIQTIISLQFKSYSRQFWRCHR